MRLVAELLYGPRAVDHFDSAISNTKAGMVDIGLWSNKGFASEIFILIELCESVKRCTIRVLVQSANTSNNE